MCAVGRGACTRRGLGLRRKYRRTRSQPPHDHQITRVDVRRGVSQRAAGAPACCFCCASASASSIVMWRARPRVCPARGGAAPWLQIAAKHSRAASYGAGSGGRRLEMAWGAFLPCFFLRRCGPRRRALLRGGAFSAAMGARWISDGRSNRLHSGLGRTRTSTFNLCKQVLSEDSTLQRPTAGMVPRLSLPPLTLSSGCSQRRRRRSEAESGVA